MRSTARAGRVAYAPMRTVLAGMLIALAGLMLPSASAAATPESRSAGKGGHAVVFVSGLSSIAPYTKAGHRCRTGPYWAGREATFLFSAFRRAGYRTYTVPAQDGPGRAPRSVEGQYGDCPVQPPVNITLNTIAPLDVNVGRLLNFLRYLHRKEGVTRVWLVAHSMGGILSRGAINRIANAPRRVRATLPAVKGLTTIATPHLGAFLADVAVGIKSEDEVCRGDAVCEATTGVAKSTVARYQPAISQITYRYLVGTRSNPGWGTRRGRVPRSIPVYAIAARRLTIPGKTDRYDTPNDGYLGVGSAHPASLKRNGVLPSLRCIRSFDDVHSVGLARNLATFFGMQTTPVVADPAVANAIIRAMRGQSVPSVNC
jgi:pimeloyl-ACP methyl ester carboxylesterase